MKNLLRVLVLFCLILSKGVSGFQRFAHNASYNAIVRLLRNENGVSAQRKSLATTAKLVALSSGQKLENLRGAHSSCPMAASVALAERYLRNGEMKMASLWLYHAAVMERDSQAFYLLPSKIFPTPQGHLVLDWATWAFRGDSSVNRAIYIEYDRRILSYPNTLNKRDNLVLKWLGDDAPLPLICWHTLRVRVRPGEGTWFTLETRVDDSLVRHINYYQGLGQWEKFDIPLEGDYISTIYISLREPTQKEEKNKEYEAELEPLMLLIEQPIEYGGP